MNKWLSAIGVASLVLWTGAGFLAWSSAARHVSVTFHEGTDDEPGVARILELADRVGALHEDVRALAGHLGESLAALDQDFEERLTARASALEREVLTLRAEQAARGSGSEAVLRELEALRQSLRGSDPVLETAPPVRAAPTAVLGPLAERRPTSIDPAALSAPAEEAPVAPRKKSFLAFELPSDSFRFDRRTTWTVLPALSRVGFDAKSTLHDFSGVTSKIEGTLTVDPSRPEVDPRGSIRVSAATLATGVDGRDEAMRDHLGTVEHPEISFELERFETESIDAPSLSVSGRVHGTMSIRGVGRPVAMPVRVAVDDARRLAVEGETTLHLPDFQVAVPNKLGVISMDEDVQVWIALKLRASAVAND